MKHSFNQHSQWEMNPNMNVLPQKIKKHIPGM